MDLLFFDTETCGTSKNESNDNDFLFEIAYKENKKDTVSHLFKPQKEITPYGSMIHHMINEDVEKFQKFKDSRAYQEVSSFIENDYIFVAHNIEFDIKMLLNEGLKIPKDFICTFLVAKAILDEQNYSMQYLRYKYELALNKRNSHRAEVDVDVLFELFTFLLDKIKIKYKLDKNLKAIQKMIEITRESLKYENYVCYLGKYKGKTIKEINKIDSGYLNYVINNFDDNNQLKIYAYNYINDIKHWLL